jgi:hypothetical protein
MESTSRVIARESGRSSNPGNAGEYWIRFRGNDTAELVTAVWFHFTGTRYNEISL